ncbi:hypothetical protein AB1K84_03540 [Mesobacillus foraminis]|uniref:hypothetical protein n=1 Tax=Mesobacillus foraminis TaxID=279826 RepID=UPI0039A38AC7
MPACPFVMLALLNNMKVERIVIKSIEGCAQKLYEQNSMKSVWLKLRIKGKAEAIL